MADLKKNCETTEIEIPDFCYTKSENILRKLNENKNFCLSKDDCEISFNNLKEASKEIDKDNEPILIRVFSKEISVSCEDFINNDEDKTYLVTNTISTCKENQFTLSATLIRPSDQDIIDITAKLQNQVDQLAYNFALLSLACTIGNAEQKINCDQMIPCDSPSLPNIFNPDATYSICPKHSIYAKYSYKDILDSIDPSLWNDIPLIKTETKKSIRQCKDYVDYVAIVNMFMNLDCTISNDEQVVNCEEIELENGEIANALSIDGYSNSSIIEKQYITKVYPASYYINLLPNNGIYKTESGDLLSFEDFSSLNLDRNSFICTIISSAYDYNNLSNKVKYLDKDLKTIKELEVYTAEDETSTLIATFYTNSFDIISEVEFKQQINLEARTIAYGNLNCFYGNPKVRLYCCNNDRSISNDTICEEPFYSSYNEAGNLIINNFYPKGVSKTKEISASFAPGYIITANDIQVETINYVDIDTNEYIVRATIDTTDTTQNLDYAKQAYLEALELAKTAASLTLDSCGYYSHEIYMFCDKGYKDPSEITEAMKKVYNNMNNYLYSASYYQYKGYTENTPVDHTFKDMDISSTRLLPRLIVINYNNLLDVNANLDKNLLKEVFINAIGEEKNIYRSPYVFLIYKNDYITDNAPRLSNKDNSVSLSKLAYGSYNNLFFSAEKNISGLTDNKAYTPFYVDQLALEAVFLTISCMYGNKKFDKEGCAALGYDCSQSGGYVDGTDPNAMEIEQDYVTSLDTESADTIAETIHRASAVCLCKDNTGGGSGSSYSVNSSVNISCSNCKTGCCVFCDE